MPNKKSPGKQKRQTEFVAIQVWPATREIARELAGLRRQKIAVVIDDVLRAAYAAEAIVTADEGDMTEACDCRVQ